MAFERITLNIIPDGEMPVFHCSQYETGRPIIIDLVSSDDDAFTIGEGVSVELHCRKVDDNIVTLEPDEVDTNSVTFVSTEQLTACIGDNLCELVLYADTDPVQTLGTLNFIIHVECDPIAGGVESETAIYNLTEQIEDIISGEGYLKSDDVAPVALSGSYNDLTDKPTIPDMSNYYTKSETYNKTQVDDALALKANTADLATVATTGDFDDLLNKPTIPAAQVNSDWNAVSGVAEILNKPTIPTNTSDLNNDSDFQNETEVNNLIAEALLAVMPVDSATGNPCTFETEIAAPLVGCKATLVSTGGGGTPSSPVPIVGYSAVNLDANGTTHTISLGDTYYGGVLDVTKGKLSNTFDYVDLGNYYWTYNPNYGFISVGLQSVIKNAPTYGTKANILCTKYVNDTYNNVTDGLTNYHIAVSGGGYGYVVISDDRYNTEYAFNQAIRGTYLAFEKKTATEVDVTPEQISALLGVNNISSDAVGDVEVQFKDTIQHYIDNH